MVLSEKHTRNIQYRSIHPILMSVMPEGRNEIKLNVVFPTGIDCRDDHSLPNHFDVYYGIADARKCFYV